MFKWNDKVHFYVRLAALIALSLFLIVDVTLATYDPQPQFRMLSYTERISNYYSFFTTQTNYLVAFYFFLYLFDSKFKNTKPHFVIRLGVTTYITITMLVFWLGLFTQKGQAEQYNTYRWVATVVLHLVMPITMIINYILTTGEYYYPYEKHHKSFLWLIMSYMVAYLIIIVIRGTYRHLEGKPEHTLFPYFFLNYFGPGGIPLLLSSIIMICTLAVALQYFYIWVNNMLYVKVHHKGPFVKTKLERSRLQVSKLCLAGGIIGLITTTINFLISMLLLLLLVVFDSDDLDFSLEGVPIPGGHSTMAIVAALVVSVFLITAFIICFVLAMQRRIGGRIAGGIVLIMLIFVSWIWIIGPILAIIGGILMLAGKEKIRSDRPFPTSPTVTHSNEIIDVKVKTKKVKKTKPKSV
ncbi:hypothetical protein [Spiroplasma sp. DGKH1]|uniref:hypothetical protein n=1 Tax=Spiroplasma sp. DGKH1 TaxID=3050074 RepID=UPI0034C5EFBC